MATLPQLVKSLQPVDGRDEATIAQVGRLLREAGHLPKGKRGAGAPQMSAENAVSLLLGAYGSQSPKDAPEVLSTLKTLECWRVEGTAPFDCLSAIEKQTSLFDALVHILLGFPEITISLAQHVSSQVISDEAKRAFGEMFLRGDGPLRLEVMFSRVHAEIRLFFNGPNPDWQAVFGVNDDLFMSGFYPEKEADRQVSVTFGLATIFAIWFCINDLNGKRDHG